MAADNKREQERKALHDAIWAIADELRGAVDGWDFKNYVLGTMFYRYISENLASYIDEGEHAAGDPEFSYAKMNDKDAESAKKDLIQEKGFFIPPSQLFINVLVNQAAKQLPLLILKVKRRAYRKILTNIWNLYSII